MKKMSTRYGVLTLLAVMMLVAFAGCAKPPTEEMSDARMAFQAATDAEAQTYASDKYMSAEEALNEATALMERKKYKEAREKALEALKLSREAHANAVTSRNMANRGAEEIYEMALAVLNSANQAGAYTYAEAQMLDAERTLEEAKRAYEAGDYVGAKQLAQAALEKAQEAEAIAKQVGMQKQEEQARRIAGEIADPGATRMPYPTNHVVIKGETLWWIAEYKQIYDDPFQWPVIYRANRDKIRDPDLIYPDQNFVIPREPDLTNEMRQEAIKFAKNRGAWSLYDGK
jgi:tetratricopeptide (TPR) repeat protein